MTPFDAPILPPHSVEAEQAVLGGLLLDNTAWDRIADIAKVEHVYSADHRTILAQIVRLIDAGKPADVITVAEALESNNQLDGVGGLAYLATLAQNTPSAANIRRYAEIVRERAVLRKLVEVSGEIAEAAYNPAGRTAAEIAAEAETALAAYTADDRDAGEPVSAAQAMAEVLLRAEDAAGRGGLMTGLADLDTLTGGLEPGQLVIVAARPAVGKTAVALSIARHVAAQGGRVSFHSLEMGHRELAARLLAATARINARALKTGPSPDEWERLAQATAAPGLAGLYLDDTPAASVARVRARARRLQRAGGLGLIVVDYLQLMAPADKRANRTEQVGSLSRGLKAVAKELGVPVIALAQLNRQSEARADRRPMLSDLRDSGEVEQDADAVLLLHRASDDGAVIEAILAKHRSGPTGSFWLKFQAETMTFSRHQFVPQPTRPTRPRGFDE